jgi:hypothetical protein
MYSLSCAISISTLVHRANYFDSAIKSSSTIVALKDHIIPKSTVPFKDFIGLPILLKELHQCSNWFTTGFQKLQDHYQHFIILLVMENLSHAFSSALISSFKSIFSTNVLYDVHQNSILHYHLAIMKIPNCNQQDNSQRSEHFFK